jgi:putative endonuclease
VVERNWRCDAGEVDLIVAGQGVADRVAGNRVIVFVEVKARASDRFGSAAGAVDDRKQRRLRVLAARWFAAHPEYHGDMRFDVVAITGTDVEVIENAF